MRIYLRPGHGPEIPLEVPDDLFAQAADIAVIPSKEALALVTYVWQSPRQAIATGAFALSGPAARRLVEEVRELSPRTQEFPWLIDRTAH